MLTRSNIYVPVRSYQELVNLAYSPLGALTKGNQADKEPDSIGQSAERLKLGDRDGMKPQVVASPRPVQGNSGLPADPYVTGMRQAARRTVAKWHHEHPEAAAARF